MTLDDSFLSGGEAQPFVKPQQTCYRLKKSRQRRTLIFRLDRLLASFIPSETPQEAVGRVSQLHDERLRDVEALLERAATKSELHLKADARHTEVGARDFFFICLLCIFTRPLPSACTDNGGRRGVLI